MSFDPTYIISFLASSKVIMGMIIPIIIGLALILFLWGLVKFMRTQSEEEKKKGRSSMIWGIVILAVMVSVWGLVRLVQQTAGITGEETVTSPTLPE